MNPKPFQLAQTFLPNPRSESSEVLCPIWGISYDSGVSDRPGARMGPRHIRSVSRMLTDGAHPVFDVEPARHVSDQGDIITGIDPVRSLEAITKTVSVACATHRDRPLFFMGGDHSISLGILRGLTAQSPSPVLVMYDSHHDAWPDHFGEIAGHGTWVRQAVDEGLLAAKDIIQIGIRSPSDMGSRRWLPSRGADVYSAREALRNPDAVNAKIREKIGDRPFYITLDIDALDPAFAPGTGTPEVGGLTTTFMLDSLESVMQIKAKQCVGMDVVEVNPLFDCGEITSLAAATFLWTVMAGYIASGEG